MSERAWDFAPVKRIGLAHALNGGDKFLLTIVWTHANWDCDPGENYGICWASNATLAKKSGQKPKTVEARLRKLRELGYISRLRRMTPGELKIANEGRKRKKLEPLICQCKAFKRSQWADECSCRVLRPIGPNGRPASNPDGTDILNGLHVARAVHGPPSQMRAGPPSEMRMGTHLDHEGSPHPNSEDGPLLAVQGDSPLPGEGQTNQEKPPT